MANIPLDNSFGNSIDSSNERDFAMVAIFHQYFGGAFCVHNGTGDGSSG